MNYAFKKAELIPPFSLAPRRQRYKDRQAAGGIVVAALATWTGAVFWCGSSSSRLPMQKLAPHPIHAVTILKELFALLGLVVD